MAIYHDLNNTGQEVQQRLDQVPVTQADLAEEVLARQAAVVAVQNNVDAEELRAKAAEKLNADDIDAIEEKIPSGASSSNKMATASDISSLDAAIEAILLLIPSAATSLNKLADKAFVNSSIATATATFRGTKNLVSDLNLAVDATHEQIAVALSEAVSGADNNDYAFVQVPTSSGTPTEIRVTERYKFDGTAWSYEYDLNNSGFTSDQWAAINSTITSELVDKLNALQNNDPDEEDLTSVNVGGTDVLKFKDKAYSALTYSGMGRVYLRKNMVNGVNTLTQAMMPTATGGNTIYIIQYDYVLGENITVPENCVLEFDGGSLDGNYTLNLNGCYIEESPNALLCACTGSVINESLYSTTFGEAGSNDDAGILQRALNLMLSGSYTLILVGHYVIDSTLLYSKVITDYDGIKIKGLGFTASSITYTGNGSAIYITQNADLQHLSFSFFKFGFIKDIKIECTNTCEALIKIESWWKGELSGLMLDGKNNCSYGVYFPEAIEGFAYPDYYASANMQINNCYVYRFTSCGICSKNDNGTPGTQIKDCTIEQNYDGIEITSSGWKVENSSVSYNIHYGIIAGTTVYTIINCFISEIEFDANGECSVYVIKGRSIQIENSKFIYRNGKQKRMVVVGDYDTTDMLLRNCMITSDNNATLEESEILSLLYSANYLRIGSSVINNCVRREGNNISIDKIVFVEDYIQYTVSGGVIINNEAVNTGFEKTQLLARVNYANAISSSLIKLPVTARYTKNASIISEGTEIKLNCPGALYKITGSLRLTEVNITGSTPEFEIRIESMDGATMLTNGIRYLNFPVSSLRGQAVCNINFTEFEYMVFKEHSVAIHVMMRDATAKIDSNSLIMVEKI